MAHAYLRLFGSVSLLLNEQPYTGRAAQRHRLALLSLLAAHDGITRDKLLGYLWPDSTMERARNSLNESLYVLRKTLGQESIVAVGEELRLDPQFIETDLREFDRARANRELERVVAIYRGPFMDGFFLDDAPEFQDWVDLARARLAGEYRSALQSLAAAAEARADIAAQKRWCDEWVAAAPTDANAVLALMQALASSGHATAALECGHKYSALVAEQFDAEPDARVTALAEQIRNGEIAAPSLRALAARAAATTPVVRARTRRRWLVPSSIVAALSILAGGLFRSSHPHDRNVVTLAVLPFQLGANETDQQFLSVGMADAVITRLSEHEDLRVRPTSAVLPYVSRRLDVRQAGRDLDVDYLITGYVQRLPDALEVRMQLISIPESAVKWGRSYRIPNEHLSTLQDSIASDLSSTIPIQRSAPRRASPSIDAAAYESYIRGRALLAQHREAELREAIQLFERAIHRSRNFAPAYAGLAVASAEMHLRFASTRDGNSWAERALTNARRALALDSTLAEVHQALAAVHRKTEFDWIATIQESRKAIQLNPNLSTPYFYMGGAYYHLGLLDKAREVVRAGMREQPQVDRVEALRTLGTIELASGNYARAVTLLQDVQRNSDRAVGDPHLAAAYFYNGDVARARQLLESLLAGSSASAATRARAFLASILAARGQRDSALVLLQQATRGEIDHHAAYSIGATYAQLGQHDQAVKWLQIAVDTGLQTYPWYERDPLLEPIRDEPEFRAFMRSFKRMWLAQRRQAGL